MIEAEGRIGKCPPAIPDQGRQPDKKVTVNQLAVGADVVAHVRRSLPVGDLFRLKAT